MSLINRVLKDLDRKGAAPASLSGVQVVHQRPAPARRAWRWVVPPLAAGLAAVWWFWPQPQPAIQTPAPPPQEAAPQLRMSETLSDPLAAPPPGEGGRAPETTPAPLAAVPEPTRSAPPPARGEPSQRETSPRDTSRDFTPPVRLDTRLPEPRPARILKEARPPTPGEQAEQSWREATRLIEQGRGHAALEWLEAALRLDPNHAQARQSLIALSLETGDTTRGEALLREGMRVHPNDAWYHRGLGQLYLQRGDAAQAAILLKSGLGKGVDAEYWGLYAAVLGKSGRHEEAARAYGEAARLNPEHGPWWLGLAVSLEQGGQRADAAAAYRRALQSRLGTELRDFAAKKAAELGGR